MAFKKILIIDDDPDYVEAVGTLLEAKNYKIDSASNGDDGFHKAVQDKPDLIILDVMMTRKDEGVNVARKLRGEESTSGIPIILVTGIRKEMRLPFGFEPDEENLPVKAVLEKPVKPDVLLKTVAESFSKV
ncbi:MAG: response regulator [Fibrobacterota bacterium]